MIGYPNIKSLYLKNLRRFMIIWEFFIKVTRKKNESFIKEMVKERNKHLYILLQLFSHLKNVHVKKTIMLKELSCDIYTSQIFFKRKTKDKIIFKK